MSSLQVYPPHSLLSQLDRTPLHVLDGLDRTLFPPDEEFAFGDIGGDDGRPGKEHRSEGVDGVGGEEGVAARRYTDGVDDEFGFFSSSFLDFSVVLLQRRTYRLDRLGTVKHARLDRLRAHVAKYGVDLGGDHVGRNAFDGLNASRVLSGESGDGGEGVALEGGDGLEVCLDPCAGTRVC